MGVALAVSSAIATLWFTLAHWLLGRVRAPAPVRALNAVVAVLISGWRS
jgi:hypothetical protein